MVNGLHTASRGMQLLQDKVDVVSNGLANANTIGFKKSLMVSEAEIKHSRNTEHELHQDENQRMVEKYTDFSQGPLIQTENSFDIALQGDGFLQVDGPEGLVYTRMGNFSLNANGELVTLNGFKVVDNKESPVILNGSKLEITDEGDIYEDGKFITKLGLYEVENKKDLTQTGSNTFKINDHENAQLSQNVRVKQGYIEGSNVNTIDAMVDLIRFNRSFESNQKVIQSIDGTLDKAVNSIGQLR